MEAKVLTYVIYRISLNNVLGHYLFCNLQMGTLFEGFQTSCTDYDSILGKRGDIIQGRTLYEGDVIQGNMVFYLTLWQANFSW